MDVTPKRIMKARWTTYTNTDELCKNSVSLFSQWGMALLLKWKMAVFNSNNYNPVLYYMANPVLGKSLGSDWFFLHQGFCSKDRFHGNGAIHVFWFWSEAGKFKICIQNSEKKVWIMSFFASKLSEEAKKIENFPKFQRYMEETNTFKCKPPEVYFTVRNRVPYHKLLTNLACSSRTGEYWPLVVFVQTSLRSVHTATDLRLIIPRTNLVLG